jgi:hypothetical protein
MGIRDEVKRLVDTESAAHKRLIEYVVRQLRAGRSLAAVFDDPYVTNRLSLVDRRALLEEPGVVEAAGGAAVLERMRADLEAALTSR